MLKIQHVSEIKKCLCLPKAQITFIRSCVNRYSWWNKSCDSRFTRLFIEAQSRIKRKLYYFCDAIFLQKKLRDLRLLMQFVYHVSITRNEKYSFYLLALITTSLIIIFYHAILFLFVFCTSTYFFKRLSLIIFFF